MDTLLHDLRLAVRTLLKNPLFTLAATITLALGIGANTAVFSAVNGVVLQPLPNPEPERVVYLGWARASGTSPQLSAWKYDYFRRNTSVFEAVAAYGIWATEVGEGSVPDEARGLRASQGFFRANGIQPALGRAFRARSRTATARDGDDVYPTRTGSVV